MEKLKAVDLRIGMSLKCVSAGDGKFQGATPEEGKNYNVECLDGEDDTFRNDGKWYRLNGFEVAVGRPFKPGDRVHCVSAKGAGTSSSWCKVGDVVTVVRLGDLEGGNKDSTFTAARKKDGIPNWMNNADFTLAAPAEKVGTGPEKNKVKLSKAETTLEGALRSFIESNRMTGKEIDDRVAEAVRGMVPQVSRVEISFPDGKIKELSLTHRLFPKLMKLVAAGKHVYLYGAPGSGKSTAVKQVADALERTFSYGSLNPQTPESRLIGFMHAGGRFVETEFYRCYKGGGVFCLDELDNASPSLLNTLNSLIANGAGAFPHGTVDRHRDFVLVATGNTSGNGATPRFPDRRAFDPAFKDRFVCLEWGYDEELEKAVCMGINAKAHGWLGFVRKVREYVEEKEIGLTVSPRASFDGAALWGEFSVGELAEVTLFKGLGVETREAILKECPLPSEN